MSIQIISSIRAKKHFHAHKCPLCRRVKWEVNDICNKQQDHTFPCINCCQFWRRSYSDDLLDVYLTAQEMRRLDQVSPDEKAMELDQRDKERARKQEEWLKKIAKDVPPKKPKTDVEQKQEDKEKMEELRETADVITEEELMEEIKTLREEEKL